MRLLNIRVPKMRHICSVRGCGGKDTVMIARSSDLAGGIFICRDCANELYAHFNPVQEKDFEAVTEPVQEADTAAEDAVQSAHKTAQKRTGKSKSK